MNSSRTFIAIELTSEVRARVTHHIACLRRELPEVRASWSREDNLHLTLKFLGNVPVADIPKVSDAVASATKSISSFEVTISDCGTFPPHGRASVLWIGAQASGLQALHAAIDQELAAAGFPRESRPFHPHLTIARLRSSHGARELAELHKRLDFNSTTFSVSDVAVFKSDLRALSAHHTVLKRVQLSSGFRVS